MPEYRAKCQAPDCGWGGKDTHAQAEAALAECRAHVDAVHYEVGIEIAPNARGWAETVHRETAYLFQTIVDKGVP